MLIFSRSEFPFYMQFFLYFMRYARKRTKKVAYFRHNYKSFINKTKIASGPLGIMSPYHGLTATSSTSFIYLYNTRVWSIALCAFIPTTKS